MSMPQPYLAAPKRACWSRAMVRACHPAARLSTVGGYIIRGGCGVMVAGDSFAANLGPSLVTSRLHYRRTETAHFALDRAPAADFGNSEFAVSYGNIAVLRQLLQRLRRALGRSFSSGQGLGEFVGVFRPGVRHRARSQPEFGALAGQHLASTRHTPAEPRRGLSQAIRAGLMMGRPALAPATA